MVPHGRHRILGTEAFCELKGRQDDMFKTGAGKFIAPEAVEKTLYGSEYISQCLVGGASRSAPFVLIVPRFDRLEACAKPKKCIGLRHNLWC